MALEATLAVSQVEEGMNMTIAAVARGAAAAVVSEKADTARAETYIDELLVDDVVAVACVGGIFGSDPALPVADSPVGGGGAAAAAVVVVA